MSDMDPTTHESVDLLDAGDVEESFDMAKESDHAMSDDSDDDGDQAGDNVDDDQLSQDDGEARGDGDEEMVQDFTDDSVQGFFGHADSIFCVALSPTRPDLCATGGSDELVYLWSITSGQQIAQLTGHTDSVTSLAFSSDGKFLASADMVGNIQIYAVTSSAANGAGEQRTECKMTTTLEAGSEVLWIQFHPRGNVLIAGTEDGTAWMWNIASGTVLGVFAGHTSQCMAGCWSADGKSFTSVSEDGTIIQWNPKTIQPEHRIETAQDERRSGGELGWNVVALDQTGKICTVGSPEGRIKVINLASGALLASLDDQTESIESIVYADNGNLMATASVDGSIALYETPSMKLRSIMRHDDAVVALQFEAGGNVLYSCSVDRSIRKWDTRSSAQLAIWKGHQDAILCMAIQKGGRKIVSCGDDNVALVFDA